MRKLTYHKCRVQNNKYNKNRNNNKIAIYIVINDNTYSTRINDEL